MSVASRVSIREGKLLKVVFFLYTPNKSSFTKLKPWARSKASETNFEKKLEDSMSKRVPLLAILNK